MVDTESTTCESPPVCRAIRGNDSDPLSFEYVAQARAAAFEGLFSFDKAGAGLRGHGLDNVTLEVTMQL